MELNHRNRVSGLYRSLIVVLFLTLSFYGCKVSYSFSGASVSANAKTFSVQYFQNRAPLVQPGLSLAFTDALIDKCKTQTSLKYTSSSGDAAFEGEIIGYNTQPLTVAADAQAAMNRFTITVNVKFVNSIEPEKSFEQKFTRYEDYDSKFDLSQIEKEKSEKIIEMLVDDIFNQAFVNW
jgi:hypothetical protein